MQNRRLNRRRIVMHSVAAEMATELEKPLRPLVAMVVWALLVWLLEALTSKCPRLRKYISGAPSIIFDNGKLYRRNMKKARLDLSEFLIHCRQVSENNRTGNASLAYSKRYSCNSEIHTYRENGREF